MIDDNHEKFYDNIKEEVSGVLRITIPAKIAQGAGLKKGDKLKIWIRKIEEDDKI